jgi:hypothetical protein
MFQLLTLAGKHLADLQDATMGEKELLERSKELDLALFWNRKARPCKGRFDDVDEKLGLDDHSFVFDLDETADSRCIAMVVFTLVNADSCAIIAVLLAFGNLIWAFFYPVYAALASFWSLVEHLNGGFSTFYEMVLPWSKFWKRRDVT